jgi:hypothetical protein
MLAGRVYRNLTTVRQTGFTGSCGLFASRSSVRADMLVDLRALNQPILSGLSRLLIGFFNS